MRRSGWTDARLDDKMGAIDATHEMLREEMQGMRRELREEVGGLRREVREEIGGLRRDFAALQTTLVQIGFGMVGVLLAAMIALIIAVA
jgi:hypothetical protein